MMPPQVDFSILGDLGKTYEEAKLKAGRERALTGLREGGSIEDTSRALFQAGDVEGGIALAKLADAQALRQYTIKKDERDFGFRQSESVREQKNADRQFEATTEGQKVPPGFQRGDAGNLFPIQGGPADPAYVKQAADAKHKPREFSVTDVTKLSEEGGKYANISKFADTFEPRFAGYKAPILGDVSTWAGRHLPEGVVGKDVSQGSTWWQSYDRYKNVVRNDLFGAALTKNEQAAFEKADINPGMDPAQIQKNLATQKEIVMNGLKRKANALIASGYDPKAIASAYGLNLEDIGVTAQPRGGAAASQPSAAPPPAQPKIDTEGAIRYLRANPNTAEQFDAFFGPGSAARVLGVVR